MQYKSSWREQTNENNTTCNAIDCLENLFCDIGTCLCIVVGSESNITVDVTFNCSENAPSDFDNNDVILGKIKQNHVCVSDYYPEGTICNTETCIYG